MSNDQKVRIQEQDDKVIIEIDTTGVGASIADSVAFHAESLQSVTPERE